MYVKLIPLCICVDPFIDMIYHSCNLDMIRWRNLDMILLSDYNMI